MLPLLIGRPQFPVDFCWVGFRLVAVAVLGIVEVGFICMELGSWDLFVVWDVCCGCTRQEMEDVISMDLVYFDLPDLQLSAVADSARAEGHYLYTTRCTLICLICDSPALAASMGAEG